MPTQSKHRKNPIGRWFAIKQRHRKLIFGQISMQHHPQTQKENIHHHHHKTRSDHVLLCILERFTTQILLHHVLIQARHRNAHRCATQKLLPKVQLAISIPHKHITHLGGHNPLPRRFPHPFLPEVYPFQTIGQRHHTHQNATNEKYTL